MHSQWMKSRDTLFHTLITWPLASEWTLITMRRNFINFLFISDHVTLWYLEVVRVVYARVTLINSLLLMESLCGLCAECSDYNMNQSS